MTRYLRLALGTSLAASLLAVPAMASAQDAVQTSYAAQIALPDLKPEEIARDVRTEYNSRTGAPERIAPAFDPFEQDPDLAAEASLRSTGPVRDIDGRLMGDGAVLDLSLYYTSEGTRDYGRMRDALYVSGQPVPIIRRDSRELECSSRVTETVYESDRYYGGYASYGGLTRVRPRYYGHSGYDYGYGYGGYGYDDYGYGRGYGHYGRGYGRFNPRVTGGRRGPRVVEPSMPDVVAPRPAVRPISERGTGARINERDILQPSTGPDDRPVSDTRPTRPRRGDRTGRGGRVATGGGAQPRVAPSREKRRTVPISELPNTSTVATPRPNTRTQPRVRPRATSRPGRANKPNPSTRPPVSEQPRSATRPAPRVAKPRPAPVSKPKPAPVSKPRPAKPRPAPVSKPRPRSTPPTNPRSTRGANRRLELFPNGRGDAVVVSASRDCAREDQLSVFIPAERLDAARFDGLTLIVRDVVTNGATGLTQVYDERPLYIPPNYIEGFRLALSGPTLAQGGVR